MSANIEVLGNSITGILSACENKILVNRMLSTYGLPPINEVRPGEWYPREKILEVYRSIFANTGPATIRAIGQEVPVRAEFPRTIDSIAKALQSVDVGYHMNHRKDGAAMFNGETGRMLEGIGHYAATLFGPRAYQVMCDGPYPCQFDMGLLEAMADRFRTQDVTLITVKHRSNLNCRSKGHASCIYTVEW